MCGPIPLNFGASQTNKTKTDVYEKNKKHPNRIFDAVVIASKKNHPQCRCLKWYYVTIFHIAKFARVLFIFLSVPLLLKWLEIVGSMGTFVDGGSGYGDDGVASQWDSFDVNHFWLLFFNQIYFYCEKNVIFLFFFFFCFKNVSLKFFFSLSVYSTCLCWSMLYTHGHMGESL